MPQRTLSWHTYIHTCVPIPQIVRYTDGPFLSFKAFQVNKTRERRFLLKAPTLHVRNEWADAIEAIIKL